MIRIADDIYTWRVVYRLSQGDAAQLVPVAERTWRRWESGRSYPTEDHYNTLRWLIAQPPPGWTGESSLDRYKREVAEEIGGEGGR